MCIFMPYSVHNNNITVDNSDDMIPCRPAVPRIAGRLGVFAPSSFRDNNINLVSRQKTTSRCANFSDAPPNPYTNVKDGEDFDVRDGEEKEDEQQSGVISKGQIKLLEDVDPDEKWRQSKQSME